MTPFELDMALLRPVHRMMQHGIRVDFETLKEVQQEYIDKWNTDQARLDSLVGYPVNVSSNKDVGITLEALGLPVKKTKKGNYKTDEHELRDLMAKAQFKRETLVQEDAITRWTIGYLVCRLVLIIRGYRKLISSYLGYQIKSGELAGETDLTDADGRIRGVISIGGTKTSRFSHSKTLWGTGVNLATLPKKIRNIFIPDPGFEFAEFDLNRGESWVYAHLSQDPELLRIHHNGLDFHAETAAAISSAFSDEPLSVDWIVANKHDKAYRIRYLGKKINHASAYRMGPYLGTASVNEEADETGITVTTAQFKAAQNLWKEKYLLIPHWWDDVEKTMNRTRTMVNPYGRRITMHDKWSNSLLKEATAWVPQSTSVHYMNLGFLNVHNQFVQKGAWGLEVLAQTHDSILVQYKTEHRDEVFGNLPKALESTLTINRLEFSIPTEGGCGKNWRDLDDYTAT